jgi:4-oxalocrotonate tautomerase
MFRTQPANQTSHPACRTILFLSVSIRKYDDTSFHIPPAALSRHRQFCKVDQSSEVDQSKESFDAEVVFYALDGRSIEQKRSLIRDLTDAVVRNYDVDASTVSINIVETPRENKARGGVLFSDAAATT